MRILAVVQGEYGKRIVKNIRETGPADWQVEVFEAPSRLPMVIDFPDRYLPDPSLQNGEGLPQADLLLSLGESPGVADLVTAIARRTGARAVIAAIDHTRWLPPGLANQLKRELSALGIAAVFPKPFCTLTENSYGYRFAAEYYHDPLIAEFARHFGQPKLRVALDPAGETIAEVEVLRSSPCGSTRFVAEGLVNMEVEKAEYEAGMLFAHYPCLASMATEQIDVVLKSTLMHLAGSILKEMMGEQLKSAKTPAGHASAADLRKVIRDVETDPVAGNAVMD